MVKSQGTSSTHEVWFIRLVHRGWVPHYIEKNKKRNYIYNDIYIYIFVYEILLFYPVPYDRDKSTPLHPDPRERTYHDLSLQN